MKEEIEQFLKNQCNLSLDNIDRLISDISSLQHPNAIKVARPQGNKRSSTSRTFVGRQINQQTLCASALIWKDKNNNLQMAKLDHQAPQQIGNKYVKSHILGSGSTGRTKHATTNQSNEVQVVKIVDIEKIKRGDKAQNTPSIIEKLQKEEQLLRKLHIDATLLQVNKDNKPKIYVLMQDLGTELFSIIEQKQYSERWFSYEEQLNYIIKLMRAMMFVHQQGILHRDIKPENITVKEFELFLIDYDLACKFTGTSVKRKDAVGSPFYLSTTLANQLLHSSQDTHLTYSPKTDAGSMRGVCSSVMGFAVPRDLHPSKDPQKFQQTIREIAEGNIFTEQFRKDKLTKKEKHLKEIIGTLESDDNQTIFDKLLTLQQQRVEDMFNTSLKEKIKLFLASFDELIKDQDPWHKYKCCVARDIIIGAAIEGNRKNFNKAIGYVEKHIIPKLNDGLKEKLVPFIQGFKNARQDISQQVTDAISTYLNNRPNNSNNYSWAVRCFDWKTGEYRATLYQTLLENTSDEKQKLIIAYTLLATTNGEKLKNAVVQQLGSNCLAKAKSLVSEKLLALYKITDAKESENKEKLSRINAAVGKIYHLVESKARERSWFMPDANMKDVTIPNEWFSEIDQPPSTPTPCCFPF